MSIGAHIRQRGSALIQALIIVAALSAVAAALLVRAQHAVARLDAGQTAAQAGLYLDSATAQALADLRAARARGPLMAGQSWEQPRSGIVIDQGTLAWQVHDLQARFNLNTLAQAGEAGLAARAAWGRFANAQGLGRDASARIADALRPETSALTLPLAHPLQLAALVEEERASFAALLPKIAALPAQERANINTLPRALLQALAPGLSEASLTAVIVQQRDGGFADEEALSAWATTRLDEEQAALLMLAPLTTQSRWFAFDIETRLDTQVQRRTVVANLDAPAEAVVLTLSPPGAHMAPPTGN